MKTESYKIVRMLHGLSMERLVKRMRRYARRAATNLYLDRKYKGKIPYYRVLQSRNVAFMDAAVREIRLRNIPTAEKVAAHEAALASASPSSE